MSIVVIPDLLLGYADGAVAPEVIRNTYQLNVCGKIALKHYLSLLCRRSDGTVCEKS